jgi:hypothetical protein
MIDQRRVDSERTISVDSVVVAAQSQISSDVAGEAVILDLKAGMYYGLDPIGTRVWNLIQEPKAVSYLRDVLISEYEVDAERCERDLKALCDELLHRGLIEVKHETSA